MVSMQPKEMGVRIFMYLKPTYFLVVWFVRMLTFLWRHLIQGRHLSYVDRQITAISPARC